MIYTEVNEEILNKKIKMVRQSKSPDSIIFVFEDDSFAIMLHEQECCEHVYIEDICGNLSDLEGAILYSFEEATNYDEHACESGTWTFYKIKSSKGYIDIRWYGESNGYYSEEAQVDYYSSIEDYYEYFYNPGITTIEEYIDKYYKD
jgi:hypothetical protein